MGEEAAVIGAATATLSNVAVCRGHDHTNTLMHCSRLPLMNTFSTATDGDSIKDKCNVLINYLDHIAC